MFIIEDESHAEPLKEQFLTFNQALETLKEIANIPWNKKTNKCPCKSWKTCGRNYQIIEYDDSESPWKELNRQKVLKVSTKGIEWNENLPAS